MKEWNNFVQERNLCANALAWLLISVGERRRSNTGIIIDILRVGMINLTALAMGQV